MLVLDIDGTLTNSEKKITPHTKEAILKIEEQGIITVLASGRPEAGVLPLAEELQLDRFGGFVLSFNGAKITSCRNMETIFEKTLPQAVIPILYEEAIGQNAGLVTYEGSTVICGTRHDRYLEWEAALNHLPIKDTASFVDYVSFPVNKCLMTGEPHHMEAMEKRLKMRFNQYLSIYRSEPYFLEIMPQNIDKANSLSKLLGSLGLTTDQMICCGDGYNDVTMIEYAGLGVAMSNALGIVKNVSDYITYSNDEEGIVHVINKFILKTAANSN